MDFNAIPSGDDIRSRDRRRIALHNQDVMIPMN
jgi:hypothetical protein